MIFDTKINTSGFDAGIGTLSGKAKSALSTVGGSIASGMGSIAAGALGAASAAVVAGFTAEVGAVVKLTKDAVSNYADYEQLVGGVETLFKDSASTVIANADKAFETAGVSANDYMDTVTSFSASLLQSLNWDTAKAAKAADRALTDMSDNANKMGTDFKMIQNAYQGFAKQNYTMLDNLKLGYGGTKGEMERLIEDANKLKEANGEMADLSVDSFSDVVEAIGLIQDKMGITGTTAKEAATTIQGSFGRVKASFTNLLTGMADPSRDVDELFDQLEESVYTALDNVMPAIETAAPRITEGLVRAIKTGVEGIANNPDLSSGVSDNLSMLLDGAVEILDVGNANFGKIADGIFGGLKDAITPERVGDLVSGLFGSASGLLDSVSKHGPDIVSSLFKGIQKGIENGEVRNFVDSVAELLIAALWALADNIDEMQAIGVQVVTAVLTGVITHLPEILASALSGALAAGFSFVEGIVRKIGGWFGLNIDDYTNPHAGPAQKTPAEELAHRQTEGYYWAVQSQLAQSGRDWSYQDYLDNEGWNLFDDAGTLIEEAQKQGEADGKEAAGAYKEGFGAGMQEQFDTEEEYIAAMTAMGITEFAPWGAEEENGVREKGRMHGIEVGRVYLEGIDMGIEEAMIAQQMAAGNGVINYNLPEVQASLAGEDGGTGGESSDTKTNAKEASAQLVAEMQSELESALSKLKDAGGLTNVGTMMLEAIVAGMQDADNLEALSEAVTGIKAAIVGDEDSSIAKEFEEAGRDMGSSLSAGVAAGISEGSDGIQSALSEAVSAAIAEARAQVNAFAQDPFGGTRPNLTGNTTTNNTTNNTSFTFNSPKALNYRETREEVLRYDQYQQAMTP